MHRVVVVGAGPAGLAAAISASRRGARVTVLEALARPGRKLLASGGGRCNLTNTLDADEFAARLGKKGRFAIPALRAFGPGELRAFLASRGVATGSPDGFRVYPSSSRAADVLEVLLRECRNLGVTLRCGTAARALRTEDGRTEGVMTGSGLAAGDAVVVAAGGLGYPRLGGSGDGHALAAAAGHSIVPPLPALVGVVTDEAWLRACAGVSVAGVRVAIDVPGRREQAEGDFLVTHTGISGQTVLDISGTVSELLARNGRVPLAVSLLPSVGRNDWVTRIDDWGKESGRRLLSGLLSEHLPQSLARALCRRAGAEGLRAGQAPRDIRDRLAAVLFRLPLVAVATGGFERAMVTRGGVSLREVAPTTLASRRLRGLFLAGEVLDIDGPSGGFNLQWAFSSGWVAGMSAAGAPGAMTDATGAWDRSTGGG